MNYSSTETIAVQVDGLGKCYRIYKTPKDRLKQSIWRGKHKFYSEFWALRDVSLTIYRGETLGIIGCNGSGKSTLLQMICGTLTQTEGSIRTEGRIAALLELGSGFNPEFTGRENIAINARLLGLSENEVEKKFDEIVEFSEVGQFIDQPVKTYSSGMFVRLAFAIASHSDPDILIVDEALSVGDLAFQNKCVMRIKQLQENGLTLIFVSHDLSTLQLICDRAIWIHKGRMREEGDPVQVSQEYYAQTTQEKQNESQTQARVIPQQDTGIGVFLDAEVAPSSNESNKNCFETGSDVRIKFIMQAMQYIGSCVFTISVYSKDGVWMIGQTSLAQGIIWPATEKGEKLAGAIELTNLCLAPGDYKAALSACSEDLSVCYALSELYLSFSVRSVQPTWGRMQHPCNWTITNPKRETLQ